MKRTILLAIFILSPLSFAATKKSHKAKAPASNLTPFCQSLQKQTSKGAVGLRFHKFSDLYWKYLMEDDPWFATYAGYPGLNDKWPDFSLETIAAHKKDFECMLTVLNKIPGSTLKGEERVSFDLLQNALDTRIEGQKFPSEYLAISHLGGLQIDIGEGLAMMPTATKADYQNMIARLDKVPQIEEQTEILLKEGLKEHVTAVKMFLSRVPAQFDRTLTPKIEDSPLYLPFVRMSSQISKADQDELRSQALEVIKTKAYPTLQRLKSFVVTDYIPNARESIAFTSMPNGQAWYAYEVKRQTTTNLTPDQLHELGLKEVERLTKEMIHIKEQLKFKGDLAAFHKFLFSDKQFFYSDPQQLLIGYRDVAKRIDPELVKEFKTLPRLTYGVREMPAYRAAEAPAADYSGGSLDGGRPGFFNANLTDLAGRPKWGMEALTLHEAVPGHHLQISLAQEIEGLPMFRKHIFFTAFVEGWALYAEGLGEDLGMYKDLYAKYGQLNYEIWRAIRLVTDTGMHSKGWSRDQAIQYFADHMAKSPKEIAIEVDRYITWPGQALAYKVGQLKFLELREKAKAELGTKFDIREFHDQLLKHGALPLDVLTKYLDEWIVAKKKSSPPAA